MKFVCEPLASDAALAPSAARLVHGLEKLLVESEFLSSVQKHRSPSSEAVPVRDEHRQQLIAQGCHAEDWNLVRTMPAFDPLRVQAVRFRGECVLESFSDRELEIAEGIRLPSGLYDSTLIDCVVGSDALIYNAGLVAHCRIGREAVIANTRLVTCSGTTSFGNSVEMPISIEVGGREVHSFADLTLSVAEAVAKNRHDQVLIDFYRSFTARYAAAATCAFSIIEPGARITNCGKLVDVYVGRGAVVDNVTRLERVTILSETDQITRVEDNAWVRDSILQHGVHVGSSAIVDSSVLCEQSSVERQGKVSHSIIGPNTGIGEGEVTASLVGPFVGFHHQSLLIAAMWPEGKGNIGSGANVGSNHTSKAPDQEIWPGEGVFFGLGVNIKYPADFTGAPYSIIATAVTTLPQRVEFPFSLINSPSRTHEGISPAYNEITPAWVLSDDIYLVMRNEGKFRKRNKARRTAIEFEVFRPAIIDLMLDARVRLREVDGVKRLYTDRDLAGLGKNFLLEEARLAAIETYTFYIQLYGLSGLLRQMEKTLAPPAPFDMQALVADVPGRTDFRWSHERDVLSQEFPGLSAPELLRQLLHHQERVARDVQTSKERDDSRGVRIIADYRDAHAPASSDPFVQEVWRDTRELSMRVEKWLSMV